MRKPSKLKNDCFLAFGSGATYPSRHISVGQ
jgi:hypothetical protein